MSEHVKKTIQELVWGDELGEIVEEVDLKGEQRCPRCKAVVVTKEVIGKKGGRQRRIFVLSMGTCKQVKYRGF